MLQNNLNLEIIDSLKNGKILLIPTDTIWGIACDATNDRAIKKIVKLKNLEEDEGLVILVSSIEMLQKYVQNIHPKIDLLLQYYEKPVTAIYENVSDLSPIAAKNGKFAIRIVKDEFCENLINEFGKPIIATSANTKNAQYPSYFGKINSDILQGVDYIVKIRHDEKIPKNPSPIVFYDEKSKEISFIRE